MDFGVKKTSLLLMAAFLLACPFFQTGCSRNYTPGVDAKTDMAIVKWALKKAGHAGIPQTRIKYLRIAHDHAGQLEVRWPDSEKVPAFLEKHGDELERAPGQVYELSMQVRDIDSFKWATARSAKDRTQHAELLKVWKMGKQWRDYFISEYPEKTLSIFMNEAVDDYSIRFFNQYIGQFKASGYRLEFPLEKTDFEKAAEEIDPLIEETGKLKGLVIHAENFPGWDSFGALVSHLKFIKNHHREIGRIALVTDSPMGNLAEKLGSHFVAASENVVRQYES